jgi:hypothetical protein
MTCLCSIRRFSDIGHPRVRATLSGHPDSLILDTHVSEPPVLAPLDSPDLDTHVLHPDSEIGQPRAAHPDILIWTPT